MSATCVPAPTPLHAFVTRHPGCAAGTRSFGERSLKQQNKRIVFVGGPR